MEFGVNESSFILHKQNTSFPIRNSLRRQRGRVNQMMSAIFCDGGTRDDGCHGVARSHMCAAVEVGVRSRKRSGEIDRRILVRRRRANIVCYLSYTGSSV